MAKIILSLEGSVIREIPLNKDRVTIGRKPQNDIQIENLAVSSEHACIVTILADSFLEDLGSTNGTLVNGNPVKKHILQNNDLIEIGKYKMKYVVEATAATSAPAEDFEKTMILRSPKSVAAAPKPAAAPPAPKPAAPAPTPPAPPKLASAPEPTPPAPPKPAAPAPTPPAPPKPAAAPTPPAPPKPASAPAPTPPVPPKPAAPAPAQPLAALQMLTGGNAGKEIELTKNLTTLGKPGVQVAVITRRPQGYFITHVEGTNFPVVNGKALDSQARPLNDHDVIELAGVKMEFFIKK
jgi:pSer/pThr/pTyr-binding forkhead associated (FHA) protein